MGGITPLKIIEAKPYSNFTEESVFALLVREYELSIRCSHEESELFGHQRGRVMNSSADQYWKYGGTRPQCEIRTLI